MSSPSFRFQQFEVYHDRCAMKVGTDGVLLGAWIQTGSARRILDVGAGSGLITLILAQRSTAQLVGVEFDAPAAEQALENVQRSPWKDRISILRTDVRTFNDGLFDLIVSNPPYFQNALQPPKAQRNQARHDVTLSYEELVKKAQSLLSAEGRLAVVLPIESAQEFEDRCWESNLFLTKRCDVSTLQGQAPKRVLMEFSRKRGVVERTVLTLGEKGNVRTQAYSALTSDLYL
ncbi:MAG TPA: methyltransferase [Bacteroidales bacterium]|nr:methyltransferase [Bacteroidales bacterium]